MGLQAVGKRITPKTAVGWWVEGGGGEQGKEKKKMSGK